MASEPARHLRVADEETGELLAEDCPNCAHTRDQLAGAEKENRAWRTRYANLKRERDADAETDPLWPVAVGVFRYYQEKCEKQRAGWTVERFELVKPFLEREGAEACREAIRGAAFDPYTKVQKNGKVKAFNDFDLIFRSQARFEDYRDRAPEQPETIRGYEMRETAHEVAERVLERAKLIEADEDPNAQASLLVEVYRVIRRWLDNPRHR